MNSPTTQTEQYLSDALDQVHKLRRKVRLMRDFIEKKLPGRQTLVDLSEYLKERESDGNHEL